MRQQNRDWAAFKYLIGNAADNVFPEFRMLVGTHHQESDIPFGAFFYQNITNTFVCHFKDYTISFYPVAA